VLQWRIQKIVLGGCAPEGVQGAKPPLRGLRAKPPDAAVLMHSL